MNKIPNRVYLSEDEMPRQWYNIRADMKEQPDPYIHPGKMQPVELDDLTPVFCRELCLQEVDTEHRFIDIPEEILDIYKVYRPSPLIRAYNLEKVLDTPAKIYYKFEGNNTSGSHKLNTAVAQGYYAKKQGITSLSTETGAGQWGSALAMACAMFGLECRVFMVRVSYDQKPYRRMMMNTWGAECFPSPSERTEAGRQILAAHPDSPGSLGIAISEAIEDAISHDSSRYSLGSVLNHVALHQTIIGLEAQKQFEKIGAYPDVVIGCAGGGSNFAGISLPFVRDKIHGKLVRVIGAEPTSCPTMTRGPFAYDFGDLAKKTPLLPMYTLGHDYVPAPIHAGGLRYHGMSPIISHLLRLGLIEAAAYDQIATFEAGVQWARTEGVIPAPETNHAIAAVIEEAKRAKAEGKERTILFNFSGHGMVDLASYDAYLAGKLIPYKLPDEEIARALKAIEGFPKP